MLPSFENVFVFLPVRNVFKQGLTFRTFFVRYKPLLCLNFTIMPKLSECLKSALPASVGSASIWAMVGEPKEGRPKNRECCARKETAQSMFRDCQGTSMRKRVRDHVRTSYGGSIVASIRLGDYTTCVCKCKIR